MKIAFSFLAPFLFFVGAHAELKTVPSVDLQQYLGVWYQAAANPMPFDQGCVCSRQVLSLLNTGNVGVYNSCNDTTIDGPIKDISGTAVVVDKNTNAKLEVDFGMPYKGNYWIIGLDPQYRYAVVSDPTRLSLFILSREPVLDPTLYNEAVSMAATQVDTSKLIVTVQQGCQYPALR